MSEGMTILIGASFVFLFIGGMTITFLAGIDKTLSEILAELRKR